MHMNNPNRHCSHSLADIRTGEACLAGPPYKSDISKGEADLLSSNSSRVASCNVLDIIIMGKAGHIMNKITQAEGLASYGLYLRG